MKKTKKLWRKLAWTALQVERDDASASYSNLKEAEPELCITLLRLHPTFHNFLGIQKKIESSDDTWLKVSLNLYRKAKLIMKVCIVKISW